MSARRKRDYRAVFMAIIGKVNEPLALEILVSDFEAAVWKDVEHRGCTFHWCQAVWRKLQTLNLATDYMLHDSLHRFCRRIMSLPFLPSDRITAEFNAMRTSATDQRLVDLMNYIDNTWISSTLWPPSAWSAYRRTVRTNNDCESWHARLNRKALSANLPMYKLILLLHQEARIVHLNMRILSEEKQQRYTSKVHTHIQSRLAKLWNDFDTGILNSANLLRSCDKMYAPCS